MININLRILVYSLMAAFTILGCSRQQEAAPIPKEPLPLQSMNSFLSALNVSAQRITSAPTSVLREDALNQVAAEARRNLQATRIEAHVTIRDVKMRGSHSAVISVKELQTPSLPTPKDMAFILNLAGTVVLPLSPDQARTIRPGQKLIVRGIAAYHSGGVIKVSLPRPHAFARIHFKGTTPMAGAVITLVPQQYAIQDQ